jgi:hypothetical protein
VFPYKLGGFYAPNSAQINVCHQNTRKKPERQERPQAELLGNSQNFSFNTKKEKSFA